MGATVVLKNLTKVEYNGLRGKLVQYQEEKDRWLVDVIIHVGAYEEEHNELSLKRDNVRVLKPKVTTRLEKGSAKYTNKVGDNEMFEQYNGYQEESIPYEAAGGVGGDYGGGIKEDHYYEAYNAADAGGGYGGCGIVATAGKIQTVAATSSNPDSTQGLTGSGGILGASSLGTWRKPAAAPKAIEAPSNAPKSYRRKKGRVG